MCPAANDNPASSRRINVLICGGGKSGTTALLYAVAAGLEGQKNICFEPQLPEQVAFVGNAHNLCKILVDQDVAQRLAPLWPRFDKRVFIVRDVRDVLVSRLLYRAQHPGFAKDVGRVEKFLEALRRKEADVQALSLVDLLRLAGELEGVTDYIEKTLDQVLLPMHLWPSTEGTFHLVRYEDFVAHRTAPLNQYLGFAVSSTVEVPRWVQRVARTRSAGDWKNWFLASDVDQLRPHLRPFLDAFGYPDQWDLPQERQVNPEHGSRYVAWIVDLRRGGAE